MDILLGVDTLCYHCRLVTGGITHAEVLSEISDLGAQFVQLNTYHLRDLPPAGIEKLRGQAESLGLGITLAGTMVGRAAEGDIGPGVARVREWLDLARALGSPYMRVSSGFYRNELMGKPEAIRAEQRYVSDVLSAATDGAADVRVLIENHSDFTPDEYVELIETVGAERLGVFLDLINPISVLQDPLPVVRRLAPWAVGGHVKDFRMVSRYVEDKFHRRGFEVQWCYPGEGAADLPALIGGLRAGVSHSPYYLSIEGLDNYPDRADQRDRLARSFELLRGMLGAGAA
jgi:sugar phosphate isomerase/epimerase